MRIFHRADTPRERADERTFIGPAHIQRLAHDAHGVPVHVYRVEFADGGRTNWHVHSGVQWLLVIEGRIRVQVEGEPAREADGGDAIVIAPHEKHWHGAAPGGSGTHLAVNVNFETEWLEPVTEHDYRAPVT